MTTKNIISTPWAVIITFHWWPSGEQGQLASANRRSPSVHMYCTPGFISSIRM